MNKTNSCLFHNIKGNYQQEPLMIAWLIAVIIYLFSNPVLAQEVLGGSYGKGIDFNTQNNGIITQIPAAPGRLEGNSYLYDHWLVSSLDFGEKGKAEGLYIRYDLLNAIFEIRLQNQVKLISSRYVHGFSVIDTTGIKHVYINCDTFKIAGERNPEGFFEILLQGKYSLLLYTQAIIIKSNYVTALDMGYRNDKISLQKSYLIAEDKTAYPVPGSKKKLMSLFSKVDGVGQYLKDRNIHLRKSSDLQQFVQFLNSHG